MDAAARDGDVSKILDAFHAVMTTWTKKELDDEFARQVAAQSGERLTAVCNVILAIGEQLDRDSPKSPKVVDWDGLQPLSQLFSGEALPSVQNDFLDQKFIDYLAANVEHLDAIHWRNFERLTRNFSRESGT